ncbi:MAG TPA: DUF192 domain-containing protein [Opitutaceae bacterium]|nr:DUF192 domain-containing protein [Opitutaceae bacterium]
MATLIIACSAVLVACARQQPAAPAPAPKTVSDFFDIKVGDQTVRMQLAVLEPEQEHGLMERRDLGPNDGMLFVYAKPQQMHFWMHDTPTPLDIGFFDADGVLREVYPMEPFDETTVSSRSDAIKFPLEMNQGWFSNNHVRPGAKLDLKALAAALRARGFDPAKFGLDSGK